MSYTVTIRHNYRAGCEACIAEGTALAVQALRDAQVTSITLAAATKCEHEETRPASLKPGAPLVGQQSLPMALTTTAEPNGFDS